MGVLKAVLLCLEFGSCVPRQSRYPFFCVCSYPYVFQQSVSVWLLCRSLGRRPLLPEAR